MARYGQALTDKVVARLLPPESAEVGAVAKELGVAVPTLEYWRGEAPTGRSRERAWSTGG